HQRERATTLDPDALLERGDVRSRKERLESDVAVAIDARGGTAVVLELAEERDVRWRAGGVPGAWSPVTAIRRRTTVPLAALACEAKTASAMSSVGTTSNRGRNIVGVSSRWVM